MRTTIIFLLIFTILLGGIYPIVVYGIAQGIFPTAANGSLVIQEGKIIGSHLIGQEFTNPKYFFGRPSATTPPYNANNSSGSNLSPANPAQAETVKARVDALQKLDPSNKRAVPIDLVTASASGLDPHISVQAAYYQVPRLMRLRGLKETQLDKLINTSKEPQLLGGLGQEVVNVLTLNMALDKLQPSK